VCPPSFPSVFVVYHPTPSFFVLGEFFPTRDKRICLQHYPPPFGLIPFLALFARPTFCLDFKFFFYSPEILAPMPPFFSLVRSITISPRASPTSSSLERAPVLLSLFPPLFNVPISWLPLFSSFCKKIVLPRVVRILRPPTSRSSSVDFVHCRCSALFNL